MNEAVIISIGKKNYDITNSWSNIFVCYNKRKRLKLARCLHKQLLKYKNFVDVDLLSVEAQSIKVPSAVFVSGNTLQAVIDKMEKRYETLGNSLSRNYLHYNEKHSNQSMKLSVIIVDGIDLIDDDTSSDILNKFFILTQKCRWSGIHVIALVNKIPSKHTEIFRCLEENSI